METADDSTNAYVTIVVQPQALFVNEKTLLAPILGVTSTPKFTTLPVVQIRRWKGSAMLAVVCVTYKPPHRAHPFLFGSLNNNQFGVYVIHFTNEDKNKYAVLSNVFIKIVTEDFTKSIERGGRENLQLGTGSDYSLTDEDWSNLRLGFYASVKTSKSLVYDTALPLVVSDPITLMVKDRVSGEVKPLSPTILTNILSQASLNSSFIASSSMIYQQDSSTRQSSLVTMADDNMSPLDASTSQQVSTERVTSTNTRKSNTHAAFKKFKEESFSFPTSGIGTVVGNYMREECNKWNLTTMTIRNEKLVITV